MDCINLKIAVRSILVLSLSVVTVTSVEYVYESVYESSRNNDDFPDLALDGNFSTCATTGYQSMAWWVYKMPTPRTLRSLTIHGRGAYLEVRVGDSFEDTGAQGQFQSNPRCVYIERLSDSDTQSYTCEYPQPGSVISIQSINEEHREKMEICEVVFDFTGPMFLRK